MTLGDDLCDRLERGEHVPPAALEALHGAERAAAVRALLAAPTGRRWLRALPGLDSAVAARLLEHEADFRGARRDNTLARAVAAAPLEALSRHAPAIASGPAAPALWERMASRPAQLIELASELARGADPAAGEATLYLLALDPLDRYQLGDAARARIAAAGLGAPDPGVRRLAAEFLVAHDPAELLAEFDALTHDAHEGVRGVVWDAAFALAREDATERAVAMLADDAEPLAARRSALSALGEHVATAELVDALSYALTHPDAALGGDAAELLYSLHRHPLIAQAALASPHERAREVARRLLDPLSGSPSAGGSRPGDPTSAVDIVEELLRRAEEREGR